MLRRQAIKLGSVMLSALTLGGWSLFRNKGSEPLLLSARDDGDGKHYAVGFRLDGTQVFSTQVAQRCHAIIHHPEQPIALFVARRPGTESYLVDLRDGRLLQTVVSQADRHFYGHAVVHKSGEWLYATENDTRDPGRGVLGVYRFEGARLDEQRGVVGDRHLQRRGQLAFQVGHDPPHFLDHLQRVGGGRGLDADVHRGRAVE